MPVVLLPLLIVMPVAVDSARPQSVSELPVDRPAVHSGISTVSALGFADETFDPAHYWLYLYKSDWGTAALSRVTDGKPGAALSLIVNAPEVSGGGFYSSAYFINNSFSYDPLVRGPIDSIDFIDQDFIRIQTTGSLDKLSGHANSVIEQDGNYYVCSIPTRPVPDHYERTERRSLHASDYSLISNLLTFATDRSVHPDFTGHTMRFGVRIGWIVSSQYPAAQADIRVNHLEFQIHPKSAG